MEKAYREVCRMKTVSIVIPAYNASQWIAETLESVLAQSFSDFEVIVVDDGSTDNTANVVSRFKRVQYIHKPNGGEGSARNVGIQAAQGEYIAFVDSDDLWFPDKLRLQLEFLKQTRMGWVYCDGYVFDGSSGKDLHKFSDVTQLHSGDILRPLFFRDFIPSPTPVIHRSVLEDVGYFNESRLIQMREDWELWLRIAARHPIGFVNRPLVRYRKHAGSNTAGENPLIAFESLKAVIESAAAREPVRLGPSKNLALALLHIEIGRSLAGKGNLQDARRVFACAWHLAPFVPQAYVFWLSCWGGALLNVVIRLRRKLFNRYA